MPVPEQPAEHIPERKEFVEELEKDSLRLDSAALKAQHISVRSALRVGDNQSIIDHR